MPSRKKIAASNTIKCIKITWFAKISSNIKVHPKYWTTRIAVESVGWPSPETRDSPRNNKKLYCGQTLVSTGNNSKLFFGKPGTGSGRFSGKGVRMRKKMIEKIEKKTGVAGPTWASWSDHEIKKLYVYMMVSGPIYLEDADLIGK